MNSSMSSVWIVVSERWPPATSVPKLTYVEQEVLDTFEGDLGWQNRERVGLPSRVESRRTLDELWNHHKGPLDIHPEHVEHYDTQWLVSIQRIRRTSLPDMAEKTFEAISGLAGKIWDNVNKRRYHSTSPS